MLVETVIPNRFFRYFKRNTLDSKVCLFIDQWLKERCKKLYIIKGIGFILLHKVDYDPGKIFTENLYLIDYIFVKPEYQRKSHGTNLIDFTVNLHNIVALVSNEDISFYRKTKFYYDAKTPDGMLNIFYKERK